MRIPSFTSLNTDFHLLPTVTLGLNVASLKAPFLAKEQNYFFSFHSSAIIRWKLQNFSSLTEFWDFKGPQKVDHA